MSGDVKDRKSPVSFLAVAKQQAFESMDVVSGAETPFVSIPMSVKSRLLVDHLTSSHFISF